jgi:hypothetical protein
MSVIIEIHNETFDLEMPPIILLIKNNVKVPEYDHNIYDINVPTY